MGQEIDVGIPCCGSTNRGFPHEKVEGGAASATLVVADTGPPPGPVTLNVNV